MRRLRRAMNIREKSVESSVAVTGSKSMKSRSNCHVLIDRHRLAVWCEHRCIVVIVGYSHFNVCRVNMARVGVLHMHGHVEERA